MAIRIMGLVLAAAGMLAAGAPGLPSNTVTFVGISGFLIEVDGKKVLIDGLTSFTSPEIEQRLLAGEAPFDGLDLVMATHSHSDHFKAALVGRFLQSHPKAAFVAPTDAADQISGFPGRVFPVRADEGKRTTLEVNGVRIQAMPLSHGTPPPGVPGIVNLGYLVTVGSVTFFHSGDIDPSQLTPELLQALGLPSEKIDFAFVPGFFLAMPEPPPFLTRGLRPRVFIAAHLPLVRRCKFRVGAEGDDGSGIQLGIAAGAATRHMDKASISLPATQPWGLKRGVLVDAQGQRFVNEDAYYGRLGEFALFHRGGRAWLVVDDAVFEKPEYPRKVAAVGETPGDLERELGLAAGSLEATLALYNRHAERGDDPLFHKSRDYVVPLATPPFGAFDCTTEASIYAAFTLGGLHTDVDGRVLDPGGEPIPGLFAAGRCTSGLSVGGYSSGLSLGDGTFFGRRAGAAAAGSR